MRSSITLAIPLAAWITACGSPPSAALSDEQRQTLVTEVVETIDGLFAAMNAHDPDAVLEHYLDSETFTYVGVSSAIPTYDLLERNLRLWYARYPEALFEYEILEVRVLNPTTGYAVVRGSSTESDALMWTQVLVREADGRWVIALEHESWPGAGLPAPKHPI